MTVSGLELVEVGCHVYALDLNSDTDADAVDVRGGIVVAIETAVDQDTGEVMRRFVTATPWRGRVRWDALRADEVAEVSPANTAFIRSLIRALAKVVAGSKRTLATDEAKAITAQAVLMEVLAQ